MELEKICYAKTCINQVILRIDFLEFIDNNIVFDSEVTKKTLSIFNKMGLKQIIRYQTMNFVSEKNKTISEQTFTEGFQQEFINADGNKIILSNKFIILEINMYKTYEDTLELFLPILKALFEKKQLTSLRTGIRYINIFNENQIKPQKKYFISSISPFINTKHKNNNCIRSIGINEYTIGDMHLNFRYGIYNPKYPHPIKKTDFILDYDCFCDEAVTGYEEICNHLNKGHNEIQRLFEESITDQLRKVMQNG
jgi:uncharacterized protein (TIGR04255 family)